MTGSVRVRAVGTEALLAEPADPADVPLLYEDLRRSVPCRDLVPAASTVLVDAPTDPVAARSYLSAWRPGPRVDTQLPAVAVEVPTTYDGADLDDVARRWGMSRADAVRTLVSTRFVVAFCGFAPGFAYCTGLDAGLALPRLERPRPRVPAGSLGLADAYAGVYPSASPGGWRLVGRTTVSLWDVTRAEPALLVPGAQVTFPEA